MTSRPFIIYALPRSRTAWLSVFLSYRDWTCHHEEAVNMRSIGDICALFSQPNTGTIETAAAQAWWLIKHYIPNIKVAVIRRPVTQVVNSILSLDVEGVATYDEAKLWRIMTYGDRMLAQIAEQPGVLSVDFDRLAEADCCAAIFEHCLPYQFDVQWWEGLRDRDIQVDAKAVLRHYFVNREAIEQFKGVCWAELRKLRRAGVELRP